MGTKTRLHCPPILSSQQPCKVGQGEEGVTGPKAPQRVSIAEARFFVTLNHSEWHHLLFEGSSTLCKMQQTLHLASFFKRAIEMVCFYRTSAPQRWCWLAFTQPFVKIVVVGQEADLQFCR
uniref:Uncharacterized protein n=1 Tax=Sphaerodactylus townsendi TaxID=933632 RepID=A0ACB8G7P1_9SAUR